MGNGSCISPGCSKNKTLLLSLASSDSTVCDRRQVTLFFSAATSIVALNCVHFVRGGRKEGKEESPESHLPSKSHSGWRSAKDLSERGGVGATNNSKFCCCPVIAVDVDDPTSSIPCDSMRFDAMQFDMIGRMIVD